VGIVSHCGQGLSSHTHIEAGCTKHLVSSQMDSDFVAGVNLLEPDAPYFVPHEVFVSHVNTAALYILMSLCFSRGEVSVKFEFVY
jgi:hypothetical protein